MERKTAKDGTLERIRSCLFMESLCSDIYHLLALNFPEERELWNELALDEESHAAALAKGMGLKGSESSMDFGVPRSFEYVRKTADYASEIRSKLINDGISLKDALKMVKRLQELKNRSYSRDLLKEKEARVKKVFQKLLEIDQTNADIINALLIKYELNRPGQRV